MKQLQVALGDRSYPIYLGQGISSKLPELLQTQGYDNTRKLFIVTDEHVAVHHLRPLLAHLREASYATASYVIPAGEGSKSLQVFEAVITAALEAGLDRKSLILALGGGVVGDLAGFVAATYMRGIDFIQLPTTILAHDSSVGGKVAVNHPLGKNMIGAFHQPAMVVYDLDFLHTLSSRELISGLAEVVKHALIKDAGFLQWLMNHREEMLNLQPDVLAEGLYRSCAVKAEVVSEDERESGLRATLNYGHTIGHAIEAVAGYGVYTHGEAVAIGIAGEARIAVEVTGVDVVAATEAALQAYRLPVRLTQPLPVDDLLAAMYHDKKFKDGQMVMILPNALGSVEIVKGIEEDVVKRCLIGLGGKR